MTHDPHYPFHVYRVGGAVRDALLGYPFHETDYVVVGATPDTMLNAKFIPVGKSFPVFLHPHTKEEYALARSERKVAKGYHGFEFHTDPNVTLEEDLKRRDLTINAMAMDEADNLIDPYGGKQDLDKKILRHVSDAFVEDPVRILRIARFAARFHHLGFTIAPETMALMKRMVQQGEVDALVAERVWKETEKAFEEQNPETYIAVLRECGALAILMPALDAALSTSAPSRFDTLQKAVALTPVAEDPVRAPIRFAALAHGLTLGNKHIPPHWEVFIDMLTQHQEAIIHWNDLNAEGLMSLLNSLDAIRRHPRFIGFLTVIEAVYGEKARKHLFDACRVSNIPLSPITQHLSGLSGIAIKEAIHDARVRAIDAWLKA